MTVFEEITTSVVSLSRNRAVLATIIVSVAFIFEHVADPDGSRLHKFVAYLSSNPTVQNWIVASELRLVGFLIFLPVIVASNARHRVPFIISILIWVLVAPEHSVWQYTLQSIFLQLLIHVQSDQARFVVILVGAVLVFSGVLVDWEKFSKGAMILSNSQNVTKLR